MRKTFQCLTLNHIPRPPRQYFVNIGAVLLSQQQSQESSKSAIRCQWRRFECDQAIQVIRQDYLEHLTMPFFRARHYGEVLAEQTPLKADSLTIPISYKPKKNF
jgi:hypothetical protein